MKLKTALTLRPRERRLVFMALLLLGCWATVSWIVQPLWGRVRAQREDIQGHVEKLQKLSRLLARTPVIEQEYEALRDYLETGEERQLQGVFLRDLETLSRETNLQLNLKPRPMKQDGQIRRFEVELDVQGSQDGLMAFLDGVLKMPRLVTVDRVRISSGFVGQTALRANLVLTKLVLPAAGSGVSRR
jgi:Tfp pilus assembly protein PilO